MKELDRIALFRLSVLGPLISRPSLERGELQALLRELAQKEYAIPGSHRRYVAEKTLQGWYYQYLRDGLDGLAPKRRCDYGRSKLSVAVQEALLAAKRENPRRSLATLQQWLEHSGQAAHGSVSRSAIHRLLQQQGLSRPLAGASVPEERRSFVAAHANDIWYGDVLHGPRVLVRGRGRKAYLVSLLDDAARLIPHSAFCLGETALDIEGVLKQAVLKRGICRKLIVDNGAAYRATTLQNICARLSIQLIHCRPFAPEGKGKLERWHRTLRSQFLSEIALGAPLELDDLNARLWAWIEQLYHRTAHSGLAGDTPLTRYQQDLVHIRPLGARAAQLDSIFHHRVRRDVRKDGTVSYHGRGFEVPYELSGKRVWLVVDPHTEQVIGVEDEAGNAIGAATPVNLIANARRRRRKPGIATAQDPVTPTAPSLVDIAVARHYRAIDPRPQSDADPSNGEQ
jgi:transposase InsO family protein